jgi:hypothetical protein
MKRLRPCIVALGLSGALLLLAPGQQTESRFQTPSVASVEVGESLRLVAGQVFSFQLRFDRAPDGYGGGEIRYTFDNEQASSTPRMSLSNGIGSTGGQVDLHDGQAIYTISLPITDDMIPGKWKLSALLLTSVQEAVADVDKTENIFKQTGTNQGSARTVNIFFDDIRLNYGDALKSPTNSSAQTGHTGVRLQFVRGIVSLAVYRHASEAG